MTPIITLFNEPYLLVEELRRRVPPQLPDSIWTPAEVEYNCGGRPLPIQGEWFACLAFGEPVYRSSEASYELALPPDDIPAFTAANGWRVWVAHDARGAVTGAFLMVHNVQAKHRGCRGSCQGAEETGAVFCVGEWHVHLDRPAALIGTVLPLPLLADWLDEMADPARGLPAGSWPKVAAALIAARM